MLCIKTMVSLEFDPFTTKPSYAGMFCHSCKSVDEILWCYTIQMKPFWWNFCIVLLISFLKDFQLTFPLTHLISERVKSDTLPKVVQG